MVLRLLSVGLLLLFPGFASLVVADGHVRFLNPDGLFKPSTFSQVAIAEGDTLVFISGQTARDDTGNVVGKGDVRRQTEMALENIELAVSAAGGSIADITSITTYVVGLKPDDRFWIGAMVKRRFPTPPAHTLIGISALAAPELLVEIEAIAVID